METKNKDNRKRFDDILSKYEGKWDDAKRELSLILQEGLDDNNVYLVAAANYWLGVVHYRSGEPGKVLSYALKASSFFLDSDDYEMSARSYNLLAVVYTVSKEYLLANDAYQKAYDILVEHPCEGFKLIYILNNFSANYYKMGDIEKTIEYAEKCIKEFDEDDPDYYRQLFTISRNLTSYYDEYGDYEKAFYYTERMKDAMKHGRNFQENENCYYTVLSRLYFSTGDIEKGIYYAEKIFALGDVDIGEHEIQEDYEKLVLNFIKISDYEKADGSCHG